MDDDGFISSHPLQAGSVGSNNETGLIFDYPEILPEPRVDVSPGFQERADLSGGLKIYDILGTLNLSCSRYLPD